MEAQRCRALGLVEIWGTVQGGAEEATREDGDCGWEMDYFETASKLIKQMRKQINDNESQVFDSWKKYLKYEKGAGQREPLRIWIGNGSIDMNP